jgi:hypothetical protein
MQDEANASIPALLEFANELRAGYALIRSGEEEESRWRCLLSVSASLPETLPPIMFSASRLPSEI